MAIIRRKPDFFSRRIILGGTVGSAIVFFMVGVLFFGTFNVTMEATNTMEFCISCHEMEENVYQELKSTIHYSNRTGVQASCSDCHVPDPWIHKMVRKVQASGEVLHKILGTVDTPEKFDEKRLLLAKRVWKTMKQTDSRECRNCHHFDNMNPKYQKPRARKQHLNAFKIGQTCIDCHKGIAHKHVRKLLDDEELDALETPNPAFIREVPEMYLAGLKEAEEIEAKEKAEKQAAKERERAAKIAAKEAEKERIKQAVAKALTAYKNRGDSGQAVESDEVTGVGIDWGDVPAREVNLFYPGQASMEWVLTGKDHGGARAFTKGGDRCFDCHDNETMDMGSRIVGGEHAKVEEPTVIPGKRGSIPVQVQAAFDDENLFLRFQWPEGDHNPVPFAEGGKMDPENQIKLAVMLATDEVEYAAQAGCWGTCHHDLNAMPHHPEGQDVTKYIKESRSKIEVKGRRGKKRGGWDKRKDDADIQAELSAGHIMDLLRVKSGSGETEDGYILADRVMEGGQELTAIATLEAGVWTVEMKRKLTTGNAGDLALTKDQIYNFGFAIHDDYTNSRYHHVSLGYRLGFNTKEAEINAVKREAKRVSATATSAAPKVAGATVGANIDWSKASSREINIFYPGQTSMEWVLTGKDHGGARAFIKGGDRCVDCHDNETMDMGPRIVGGEHAKVAEPTIIPGKRGSIPVQVEATHDGENLFLRFQWPEGDHNPVPFAEGGKMDPENPIKLAVMLATDEVEYAAQAGCWGTCHHDLNAMPHHPEGQDVTKYIKESRSKIEVKGRRGKIRGGWDKRKDDADIQAELSAGHIMDLLRVKSGSGEAEDGHILADRVMKGGQGIEASATLDAGTWSVVIQRKLASTNAGDLALAKDQIYNLGFAIHDDYTNSRYHHVSLGYRLGFDNEEAEVNAIAQ